MNLSDAEVDQLLSDGCYCDGTCVCEWHQRLQNGDARQQIASEISELFDDSWFEFLIKTVCRCEDGSTCVWHLLLEYGERREIVTGVMEKLLFVTWAKSIDDTLRDVPKPQ